MRYALALLLVGCGRLDFADADPGSDPADSAPPNAIQIAVTDDDPVAPAADHRVAGATVLVDRGTGDLERLTTDAHGIATVPAAGVVGYHVVYRTGTSWRVYTVGTGAPGAIALGGNATANTAQPMTFVLPSGAGNEYTMHVPEHCVHLFQFTTPTVAFTYDSRCDGKTVRAIAYNSTNLTKPSFLDLGAVTLGQGGSFVAKGSYAAPSPHDITVSHLPASAGAITAEILERTELDLTRLAFGDPSQTTVTGSTMTVSAAVPPGGNTLRVTTYDNALGDFISWSEQIAPAELSTAVALDATGMLPAFDALNIGDAPNLSWSARGAGGAIIAVDITAGPVYWNAYLPPAATSLAFPALPPDLGVPVPTQFDEVSVIRIDVPGASLASLLPSIDQLWRRWPHDAALLPAGGRFAQIVYSLGS